MEWRDVPGFPGYRVSEFGHLSEGGETLIADRDRYGYAYHRLVRVRGDRLREKKRFARDIVASAFLGVSDERRRVEKLLVRHRDGNVVNDHFSNLAVIPWSREYLIHDRSMCGMSEQLQRAMRQEFLASRKIVSEKSIISPVPSAPHPTLSNKGTVLRKKRRLKPDPSRIVRGGLKTQSGSSWGRECETYTSYRTPRYNRY